MVADEFVIVGRLGRPRGVDGKLYIIPDTDFPERFVGLTELFVNDKGQWKKFQIADIGLVGNKPVVAFDGIGSREEASRLTNRDVAVPKGETVVLPEGSHFLFDLEGCNVFDQETGQFVGKLIKVEKYPANDVFVIRTDDDLEMRLPAVKQFVKLIDTENKKIDVDPSGMVRG